MPDPITTAADFVRLLQLDVQVCLGAANLTLPRYATLTRADGASASALARQVGVTKQMVAKSVRELRLLNYVTSIPADDRRRQLLKVTDRGRAALDQARALELPVDLVHAMQTYIDSHTPGGGRPAAASPEGRTHP